MSSQPLLLIDSSQTSALAKNIDHSLISEAAALLLCWMDLQALGDVTGEHMSGFLTALKSPNY